MSAADERERVYHDCAEGEWRHAPRQDEHNARTGER